MKWYFYIGLIASICIAIYMMPQMIKTIKTRDTVGISILMLALAAIGDLFFVIDGIGIMCDKTSAQRISAGLPVLLGNLFGLIISSITAFFKFKNMHMARKMNMTERDFCSQYKINSELYKKNFKNKGDRLSTPSSVNN